MKFASVSSCFDTIDKVSGRLEMTELLAKLLTACDASEVEMVSNLVLGQLYPPYKSVQFNIASALMIKVGALLLAQSEEHIKERVKELGDLGLVIAEGDWVTSSNVTVHQVYDALVALANITGVGSQEEKIEAVHTLLRTLDPVSAKFVVRIILGKLRLGFSDMTLIDALSWMAVGDKSIRDDIENGYNICVDIGYIARILKQDGIDAVRHMQIQIGTPIRPAAAERLPTARAIIEKIGDCVAQPKLDGFRLQIHIDNRDKKQSHIFFYSRNLIDMSHMFPDLVLVLKNVPVTTMIAEGEAIVFDPNTGSFLPFQETVKRKRKHGIEQAVTDFPLQLFLFDVLYLNGQELLSQTHEHRRENLLAIFKNNTGSIVQVIEEKPMHTAQELENYFKANIAAGLEGLVVKKSDSVYQPGKRNFNWIKLKREEQGHLEDTIDCVVLGYYAGEGKRAQFGIGAFLVGVYNKKEDRFETVAKIGTGLKDPDWHELKKKCDALRVSIKPKNVACAKDLYPDVWVAPELVVMVRADEITISPVHTAAKTDEHLGYALRFPRFMGYRDDKGAYEATTDQEIVRLYQDQF